MKIREASRRYGVPRRTLQDRLHGRVPEKPTRMGPETILSKEEEQELVDWMINMAKCGFPLKKDDLLNTVHTIIKEDERKNPFKNGRPGRKWYNLFLKRNPQLAHRTAENISKRRAVITKKSIQKWFATLHECLKQQGVEDILDDPTRILNGDETSFVFCPKTGKVIAPRGYRNVYQIQKGKGKEAITVLLFFSASGEILPPCAVFPFVRPPKDVILSMPEDWFLGKSDNGWMKSDIFFDYMVKGLDNWLLQKNIKKPVLVFVDGHKSHLTMKLNQYCSENQIILYALPPNTTHIMQPADVSVFKPLKSEWSNTLRKWQAKPENVNTVLTKSSFCPLLNELLGNKNLAESIKNGFRKCGLYPFCSDNVDYTKCVQNSLENLSNKAQDHSESKICPEESQLSDFDTATKIIKDIKQDLENCGVDVNTVLSVIEKQKLMLNESVLTIKSYNDTVNELSSSITIKDNDEDSQYMNSSVVPVQENLDENKGNINHGMQTLPNVLIQSTNTISSILTDNLNTPSPIQKTSATNRSINRIGAISSTEWCEFEIKKEEAKQQKQDAKLHTKMAVYDEYAFSRSKFTFMPKPCPACIMVVSTRSMPLMNNVVLLFY
ncbi:hypothetical protein ILUMI_24858 [Ignelater luminosus]|uniref:HTH CENPB-type domain-containing protein n=1 Tax=Ignelater luminosus TaxID=2038154 RepID=A0A8K0C8C9_IGNLU|nr:hypothetical protein ILUMI_24858 [Ignelater luminosus]